MSFTVRAITLDLDDTLWPFAPIGERIDQVLHAGDHAEMDVAGAARAGLRSCWINREARHWQHEEIVPDLQFTTLTALADWLDTHAG